MLFCHWTDVIRAKALGAAKLSEVRHEESKRGRDPADRDILRGETCTHKEGQVRQAIRRLVPERAICPAAPTFDRDQAVEEVADQPRLHRYCGNDQADAPPAGGQLDTGNECQSAKGRKGHSGLRNPVWTDIPCGESGSDRARPSTLPGLQRPPAFALGHFTDQ